MTIAAVAGLVLLAIFALFCAATAKQSAPWRIAWPFTVGALLLAGACALCAVAVVRGLLP